MLKTCEQEAAEVAQAITKRFSYAIPESIAVIHMEVLIASTLIKWRAEAFEEAARLVELLHSSLKECNCEQSAARLRVSSTELREQK